MKKERVACEISNLDCTAPAGFGTAAGWADGSGWAKGICQSCGKPVCMQCSKVVVRRRAVPRVRQRVCQDCIDGSEA